MLQVEGLENADVRPLELEKADWCTSFRGLGTGTSGNAVVLGVSKSSGPFARGGTARTHGICMDLPPLTGIESGLTKSRSTGESTFCYRRPNWGNQSPVILTSRRAGGYDEMRTTPANQVSWSREPDGNQFPEIGQDLYKTCKRSGFYSFLFLASWIASLLALVQWASPTTLGA